MIDFPFENSDSFFLKIRFSFHPSVTRGNVTIVSTDQRSTPLIVKKIGNANNRVVVVTSSISTTPTITMANRSPINVTAINASNASRAGGPSGFIQVRQNLMATNSSTIDLTDEDDAPKQRNLPVNPPALVALNVRNRPQTVVQTPAVAQRQQIAATHQTIRNPAVANATRKVSMIRKC